MLLIAPGGMRSAIPFWERGPWNPIEEISARYRVIAMDQRNAGESKAPVHGGDGWHTYTADQLALMDHLGVDRFHVLGMCIGGPYSMGLIQASPARVPSAVLIQPIGLDGNRAAFYEMFDGWADELRATSHSAVADREWTRFRSNMYDGDFLFNVDRDFVRACQTPLLVLAGNDLYHPASISREVAQLAPHAQLIQRWKEAPDVDAAKRQIVSFLARHDPS
ncbi:MAG: alpha/beta hydrolase [Vicinamibacterales bacterium]|nr:alpha/beta hydrolase [Vicinamibacterales bacterium]MDP7479606.1 alpha/beta hydrolase [Vicinamibacterales bacterium]MDP7692833.1 alpha/beta hydrolase [Vicinamibacterales bacterium]HJN42563.1 alpha/beta hydrolase [Vicinamibacterales bacterium]